MHTVQLTKNLSPFRLLEKRICPQCEGSGLIGDDYSGDLSLPHPDIEVIVKKRETINNYMPRYPKKE